MQPTYCPKCKTQLKPSAKFCGKCGAKIEIEQVSNNSERKPVPNITELSPAVSNTPSTGIHPNDTTLVVSVVASIVFFGTLAFVYSNNVKPSVNTAQPANDTTMSVQGNAPSQTSNPQPLSPDKHDEMTKWAIKQGLNMDVESNDPRIRTRGFIRSGDEMLSRGNLSGARQEWIFGVSIAPGSPESKEAKQRLHDNPQH